LSSLPGNGNDIFSLSPTAPWQPTYPWHAGAPWQPVQAGGAPQQSSFLWWNLLKKPPRFPLPLQPLQLTTVPEQPVHVTIALPEQPVQLATVPLQLVAMVPEQPVQLTTTVPLQPPLQSLALR